MTVVWDLAPCSPVDIGLMMEAARTSETSFTFYHYSNQKSSLSVVLRLEPIFLSSLRYKITCYMNISFGCVSAYFVLRFYIHWFHISTAKLTLPAIPV
jgi:hypothetical protein